VSSSTGTLQFISKVLNGDAVRDLCGQVKFTQQRKVNCHITCFNLEQTQTMKSSPNDPMTLMNLKPVCSTCFSQIPSLLCIFYASFFKNTFLFIYKNIANVDDDVEAF